MQHDSENRHGHGQGPGVTQAHSLAWQTCSPVGRQACADQDKGGRVQLRGATARAGRFFIQALSSPRLAQSPAMTWAVQWLSAAGLGELGCTRTLTPGCLPVPIANPAKRALCHSGLEQRMGRAKLPAKHRSAPVRQRSSNSSTSSGQSQWKASCDARC